MTKRTLPAYIYRKPNGLYFQRRGWPTTRIEAKAGTPEFALEYATILNGTQVQPKTTARDFNALVASYLASPRYARARA